MVLFKNTPDDIIMDDTQDDIMMDDTLDDIIDLLLLDMLLYHTGRHS